MPAEQDAQAPAQDVFTPSNINVPPRQQGAMASPSRLAATHQRVTLRNTSPNQTHIVLDRNYQPVELRPGHSMEIDMVADEIQNLIDQRRPGRGLIHRYNPRVPGGIEAVERPQHPVVVEGFENPGPLPPPEAPRARAK